MSHLSAGNPTKGQTMSFLPAPIGPVAPTVVDAIRAEIVAADRAYSNSLDNRVRWSNLVAAYRTAYAAAVDAANSLAPGADDLVDELERWADEMDVVLAWPLTMGMVYRALAANDYVTDMTLHTTITGARWIAIDVDENGTFDGWIDAAPSDPGVVVVRGFGSLQDRRFIAETLTDLVDYVAGRLVMRSAI
ncbi:hypothetical protein GoPhGRU1p77 [Gordonia phage GRU1]|uniref:Uncharacterized protein n=1 Tax=Gordonia phage GRU1 TaxID=1109710 RepID=G8EK36_9CAUD|nr:hypothetical protein GoPhGRU1p77 [Gordonia phage GRU1]AET09918.1 hypothetical protein [Gordonia phage GRU1]